MKHGSRAIVLRCPSDRLVKAVLNLLHSNFFLKFWRKRLSHELPYLAIWLKLMRPGMERKQIMVSMKNFLKDLFNFATRERVCLQILSSWSSWLVFMLI